jgi:hypothetical protein
MHQFVSFGGTSISSSYNGQSTFAIPERVAGGGAPASVFGAIIIDVTDYKSETKNKVMKSLGGVESNSNNTNGSVYFNSNMLTKPISVNRLDFAQETGNFAENTVISLYGVK